MYEENISLLSLFYKRRLINDEDGTTQIALIMFLRIYLQIYKSIIIYDLDVLYL